MRTALAVLFVALSAAPPQAAECQSTQFDDAHFSWCRVDLSNETLRLWLNDATGQAFGSFERLDQTLIERGQSLGIAMNGGMFHADRRAVGLYIEDRQEVAPIVTSDGPGNFGLLPNGVFCIGAGWAAVIESRRFAADPPACDYATQSGPMLLIDGALHPRFLVDSDSLNIRNGVGVAADGTAVFLAISDARVNFHHFARFFRDALGTPNALYLDGSISQLYAPGLGRADQGARLGPLLGTVEPANSATSNP